MEEGRCGNWLFVLTKKPKSGIWMAFDPDAGTWHALPPIDDIGAPRRHFGFSCVGVSMRLLVIGGFFSTFELPIHSYRFHATNEVRQFDLLTRRWSRVASMNVPRCSFACAVVGGKVYVAGGCRSSRRIPMADAEVYDPVEDRWETITPLPFAREGFVGVALGNQFYVMEGLVESRADQRTIQVYDPGPATWSSLPCAWLYSRQVPCPVTSVRGFIYASDNWDANNTLKVYNPGTRDWASIGRIPDVEVAGVERGMKRFDFGLVGLGQQLYVIGGKGVGWQHSQGQGNTFDILKLNDVMCCDPSFGERAVWRRVEGMGESRGVVLGCAVIEE